MYNSYTDYNEMDNCSKRQQVRAHASAVSHMTSYCQTSRNASNGIGINLRTYFDVVLVRAECDINQILEN